jgi:hypothetical protein
MTVFAGVFSRTALLIKSKPPPTKRNEENYHHHALQSDALGCDSINFLGQYDFLTTLFSDSSRVRPGYCDSGEGYYNSAI